MVEIKVNFHVIIETLPTSDEKSNSQTLLETSTMITYRSKETTTTLTKKSYLRAAIVVKTFLQSQMRSNLF